MRAILGDKYDFVEEIYFKKDSVVLKAKNKVFAQELFLVQKEISSKIKMKVVVM